jgi:hypothetical protein
MMPMHPIGAAGPRAARDRSGSRTLIAAGLTWFVSYFAARVALEILPSTENATRLAIALAPVVPFVVFLLAFIAHLRRADELERRIQLEALAIAFPLTLVLLMLLGLVELAVPLDRDDWSYRHVWAYVPIFWLLGAAIARRRYA